MAVLYRSKSVGEKIASALGATGIPSYWLNRDKKSRFFDPGEDSVKVMTFHSSKGLEFDTVVVAGIGALPLKGQDNAAEARLLYVAMTRAMNHLLLTASQESEFFNRLKEIVGVREAA